jgi:hypothetical protein
MHACPACAQAAKRAAVIRVRYRPGAVAATLRAGLERRR